MLCLKFSDGSIYTFGIFDDLFGIWLLGRNIDLSVDTGLQYVKFFDELTYTDFLWSMYLILLLLLSTSLLTLVQYLKFSDELSYTDFATLLQFSD